MPTGVRLGSQLNSAVSRIVSDVGLVGCKKTQCGTFPLPVEGRRGRVGVWEGG